MQKNLNLKIKYRESFRPFAPSIILDSVSDWFDFKNESPYMLFVSKVKKSKIIKDNNDDDKDMKLTDKINSVRSLVPAITHVDYSARVQTVSRKSNPQYYDLLLKFKEITNCPILVNTSFNVRGEPIVCSPEDAFKCFMGTELDMLVINSFVLMKKDQDIKLKKEYKNNYELD
jgi:carbamoyltransferase